MSMNLLSSTLSPTLASARARLGIQQTSNRTPEKGTAMNAADCVDRQLRADGHKTWGWVIYRCTYTDNAQWQDFVSRLQYWIESTLEEHNGTDLIPTLDVQVHENPEYDGASPERCQGYFLQWVRLQGLHEHETLGIAQRYRYFIHVDQEALESIVREVEPPQDLLKGGYVNLCRIPADYAKFVEAGGADAMWAAREAGEEFDQPDFHLNYLDDDEEADQEEEIEDNPHEGWNEATTMRIMYTSLMVEWYGRFRAKEAWRREFVPPPEIGIRGSMYDTSKLTPKE